MELDSVFQMNRQAKILEEKISGLKDAQKHLTPTIDGLPKSRRVGSKVEDLSVAIMTLEDELATLREQIVTSSVELATLITSKVPAPAARILLARYIGCQSFKKIIAEEHYSAAHVFSLHRRGVKKFKETI
ncbi:MAG: hypothetical protein IJP68_08025 [Selenomonadaceae bacterium]|nr:hypothetical protein [Selenomonadaceae bacterium]